jgi:hypothetical protein
MFRPVLKATTIFSGRRRSPDFVTRPRTGISSLSTLIDADWVSGAPGPPTRVVRLRVKRARAYPPRKSAHTWVRAHVACPFVRPSQTHPLVFEVEGCGHAGLSGGCPPASLPPSVAGLHSTAVKLAPRRLGQAIGKLKAARDFAPARTRFAGWPGRTQAQHPITQAGTPTDP